MVVAVEAALSLRAMLLLLFPAVSDNRVVEVTVALRSLLEICFRRTAPPWVICFLFLADPAYRYLDLFFCLAISQSSASGLKWMCAYRLL